MSKSPPATPPAVELPASVRENLELCDAMLGRAKDSQLAAIFRQNFREFSSSLKTRPKTPVPKDTPKEVTAQIEMTDEANYQRNLKMLEDFSKDTVMRLIKAGVPTQ